MTTDAFVQGLPSDQILSVSRAAEYLRVTATARPPGLNVDGIARLTRRNKMSTYHYTRTMQYEGLLQQWEPGTYTPGLAIIDLAWYLSRQLTAMNKLMSVEEIANAMHRPTREVPPYLAVAADINRFSAPGTRGSAASKAVGKDRS